MMELIKSKKLFSIIISYYLVLKFIFPKYFNPLIGHHSDMIDYRYDGNGLGLIDFLTLPRPIGQIIINIFSFGDYRITLCFVVIITFLNVYLLCLISKKIFRSEDSIFLCFIYSIIVFSHPGFYINYTYDVYSTLSMTFLLLIIINYYRKEYKFKETVQVILILLMGLTKETYLFTVFIFFVFNGFFINEKLKDKYMSFLTIILSALIFLWNNYTGNVFVSLKASSADPYHIDFALNSILKTFLFYINDILNLGLVGVLILILYYNFKNRDYILKICMLFCMGLASYGPYLLLPNHIVPHYRWLGIPFLYLPVFSLINKNDNKRKIKILFLILFLIVSIIHNNNSVYNKYVWAVEPEIINNNVLSSLDIVEKHIEPGYKLLITGLYKSEETHFKSLNYMSNRIKCEYEITVLTVRESNSTFPNKFVNINELSINNLDEYDLIVAYQENGKIDKIIDLNNEDIKKYNILEIIYPRMKEFNNKPITIENLIEKGNILFSYGNKLEALKTYNEALDMSDGKNPYPNFFIGNIYEQEGNYLKAYDYYLNALELDDTNEHFKDALKRVKEILK